MYRRFFSLAMLTTLVSFPMHFSRAQSGLKADSEEWSKPFKHIPSDVILPTEIGGFRVVERTSYEGPNYTEHDVSLRYMKGGAKVDIYFTTTSDAPESIDLARHSSELKAVLNVIDLLARKGTYHNPEYGETADIKTFGGNKNPLHMVQMIVKYGQRSPSSPPLDIESSIAIAFIKNVRIKIRHSFAIPSDESELAKLREYRDEFHTSLRSLISESRIRKDIFSAILSLSRDPMDQDSAALIAGYAEASHLVRVSVNSDLLPFLKEPDYDYTPQLLAAYLAGNIQGQFDEWNFESQSKAGVEYMLNSYTKLKKSHGGVNIRLMDSWAKAKESNNLHLILERVVKN